MYGILLMASAILPYFLKLETNRGSEKKT